VVGAEWSGEQALWTVQVRRDDTGDLVIFTCGFLMMCSGYYRYDRGYTPEFPGAERFAGPIVHPQGWPADLDYAGKRVVVIGSGATAVTLVPAMAHTAAHVTMLQRSPSYVISVPAIDGMAQWLRRRLPSMAAYRTVRWKNVALMTLTYQLSRRRPGLMKSLIRRGAQRQLPAGYAVDVHFNPDYEPWDQRLCIVPDGDLFTAVTRGRASIVTDQIESFTEGGLRLRSGRELPADVIVTATGLQLLALGGVSLAVDGEPVQLPQKLSYKGMMLSGVPNLAFTIGYTNASWTLKADLTAEYVCRLLNHMRREGYVHCVPATDDPELIREPLINLTSGYVLRSVEDFPAQASTRPWRLHQNYALDRLDFRRGSVEDGVLRFFRRGGSPAGYPALRGLPVDCEPSLDSPPASPSPVAASSGERRTS
jgi:cation diffusion facilitator CzcD-associated flavoprotein CzcO